MRNLFKQAHGDVATQFSTETEVRLDTSMIKKFMVAGTVAFGILAGGAQQAHADDLTYGRIIGGAAGALIGGMATKHVRDGSVRASAMVMTGAIGSMVGEHVARPTEPQQPQQRVVYQNNYPQQQPQPVYQNSPQQRPAYQQNTYRQPEPVGAVRNSGPLMFTGDQLDMPPVITAALARTNTALVASGDAPMSNDPVATSRLAKATDHLLSSAGIFAARKDKWDDAATLVGAEGDAARARAAEGLGKARSGVEQATKEWAQVRNVFAERGLDVSRVDDAVRERLANLKEADRYEYRTTQQPAYRY